MMTEKSCNEFMSMLSSASPVPGGGGASALAGALGAALGGMVGNLTLGKKKYADVQEDIKRILSKAEKLRCELLSLVDEDARAFEPLSKAYGLPRNSEQEISEREKIMEEALRAASAVPYKIIEKAVEAIELHEELKDKGSRIALSDVGVGALMCRAALSGAALNVYINTKLMKDRQYAENLNGKTGMLVKSGEEMAEKVYNEVVKSLKG